MTSATQPTRNTLQAHQISCQRGDVLLMQNIDFSVDSGHLLRIIGANGSGKTSLLRVVAGLTEPESGTVEWNQRAITECDEYASSVGYIGHRDGLKDTLTALENLCFYQQLHTKLDPAAAERSLAELGILHCADLPAGQLSFGQRRRLAFARLLITKLSIWLLDEPFTGIDVGGREMLEALCLTHLQGNGLIAMTHHGDLENAELQRYEQQLTL